MKFKPSLITLVLLFFSTLSIFQLQASIIVGSPVVNSGGSYNSITNTFVACQEQQIMFVYNCISTNNESITVDVASSNLSSFFPAGSFSVFQVYPNAGFEDVIDVYVLINAPLPTEPFSGIYDGINIGLVTATESATIEFNLLVPTGILSASDVEFCANTPHSIQLSVVPNSNDIDLDLTSINWSGPASAQINNPTSSITMVDIDALNQFESLLFTCSGNTLPDPVTGVICSFTNTITVSANLVGNNVTQTITACDSYTWIDGYTYFSSNNTSTHLLTNIEGCDSLINLDLTIFTTPMVDLMFSVAECDNFILPILGEGNYYTESGGMGSLLNPGESITTTQDLYIYAENGQCSDENSFSVIINQSPNDGISQNGLTLSSDANGANYAWLDCNNALSQIPGETGQSFTVNENGSYAVRVYANGCVVVSECVEITFVGIFENSFRNNLAVYPNPTTGNFTIDLGEVHENTLVLITDLSGKQILSKTFTQSQVLSLSIEAAAGIYTVSVQAGDKISMIRLVKE
jgi:hypothetical protein